MATGTVKWFNEAKGYGFIAPDAGETDLFVHHSGLAGSDVETLVDGAKVQYDATEGAKGPQAVNVTVL